MCSTSAGNPPVGGHSPGLSWHAENLMWHFKMKLIPLIVGLSILVWRASSQCVPDSLINSFQILPASNLIPCIETGDSFNTVLHFKLGQDVFIPEMGTKVIFDSIAGLPFGITYQFDRMDSTYRNEIRGCITFTGVTFAPPGRYYIYIYGRHYTYQHNSIVDSSHGEIISSVNQSLQSLDTLGITIDSIPRPYFEIIAYNDSCTHLTTTSVMNENSRTISVYPNPTNELLTFYSNLYMDKVEVIIFNSFGKTVLQSNDSGTRIDLRVNQLSKGNYFYLIEGTNFLETGKILIN